MLAGDRNLNTQLKSEVEIVIVDDDEDIRNCFKRTFINENYKSHSTSTIIETLELINRIGVNERFICIVDYKLRDENGMQLCYELAHRNVDSINFIISAGLDPTLYEHICYCESIPDNCSCVAKFLDKPISMQQLLKEIEEYI